MQNNQGAPVNVQKTEHSFILYYTFFIFTTEIINKLIKKMTIFLQKALNAFDFDGDRERRCSAERRRHGAYFTKSLGESV